MADVEDEPAPEADENEAREDIEGEEEAIEELEEPQDALEEIEEDPFELLDQDTEDNEEQERMYREYVDLAKQIDCQNAIITDLKNRRDKLCNQLCLTRKDKAEIMRLRICIDQENIKLHTMTNRAIQLQNFGSQRLYSDIELPITDVETTYFGTSSCYKPQCPSTSKRAQTAQEICDACEACETFKKRDPCESSCSHSTTDCDDICSP